MYQKLIFIFVLTFSLLSCSQNKDIEYEINKDKVDPYKLYEEALDAFDKGDYFLRTDYLPNRLFRYDGARWVKIEDSVRITTTNTDTRGNFKTNFVNNATESTINGLTTKQRQSLTNALKPKADN